MPAYKDKSTGKWYCQIYYQDRDGNNKQKKKRGFKTKREALEFESDFKKKHKGSISMKFKDFVEVYLKDMEHRWKATTIQTKRSKLENWAIPFFGDMPINEITVIDVREWQRKQKSSGLAETTQRKNHTVLSSVFNYAVKYYDLIENPCRKAGMIGSDRRGSIDFWTLEEYQDFIQYIDNPAFKVAFDTLYYTGLRLGELTALTPADFDFSIPKLNVNKNYQVIEGKEIIQTPKTEKSKRDVLIPKKLAEEIQDLINKQYDLKATERVFNLNRSSYGNMLRKVCRDHDLKRIRVHDLRHSHASLLIELGHSPVLIAERLGHDDIQQTLNTYSHLYPSKQQELSQQLNELF